MSELKNICHLLVVRLDTKDEWMQSAVYAGQDVFDSRDLRWLSEEDDKRDTSAS